jgi:hypothetical protein
VWPHAPGDSLSRRSAGAHQPGWRPAVKPRGDSSLTYTAATLPPNLLFRHPRCRLDAVGCRAVDSLAEIVRHTAMASYLSCELLARRLVRSYLGHATESEAQKTASELYKQWCAVLGLNQSMHWCGALQHCPSDQPCDHAPHHPINRMVTTPVGTARGVGRPPWHPPAAHGRYSEHLFLQCRSNGAGRQLIRLISANSARHAAAGRFRGRRPGPR